MGTIESDLQISDLRELVHRRTTGEWPEGKVPKWASKIASGLGKRVGSKEFERELEMRYLRALERALAPFARAGAAVDPRKDGAAVMIEGEDGTRCPIGYGDLRVAARVLGLETRDLKDELAVQASFEPVTGGLVMQIRRMGAYRDKPNWLLLRETADKDDDQVRKMEALGWDGRVLGSVTFTAPTETRRRSWDPLKIEQPERIKAISRLSRFGLQTGKHLGECYDRLASADAVERRCRRKWRVASDVFANRDGQAQDRLVRLSWEDAQDDRETDVVALITPEGEVRLGVPNRGWNAPKPGEPHWRLRGFPKDKADKLVAGVNTRSTRMIAEALAHLDSYGDRLTAADASAAMSALMV